LSREESRELPPELSSATLAEAPFYGLFLPVHCSDPSGYAQVRMITAPHVDST
jgi:hypothetical protein